MFSIIKLIIWIAGILVVAYFVLGYFGYEVNRNYFNESKAKCENRLSECKKELIHQGLNNAKCDFNCVNPKLIIKKK
ncbi:MAG: hypothetical protein NT136_03900 [Candidatus Moranbacteria bacterium]|nr:hypothetical protein [Candidatus Moranbacteria bacterium]